MLQPIPYDAPKPEGDIDLVQWVRDLMLVHCGVEPTEQHFDGHQYVLAAVDRHSQVQRVVLSRWFNLQLVISGETTHDQRCQLTTTNTELWQAVIEKTILPTMGKIGLPRAIA